MDCPENAKFIRLPFPFYNTLYNSICSDVSGRQICAFACICSMYICTCAGKNTSKYVEGDVRLVNGTNVAEGRVEVWYCERWNTVCDDYWSSTDANLVCQQLGYQSAVKAHREAHFGEGSGDILLDNLQCTGREASLLDCPHNGVYIHNCDHSEDAGVTCEFMLVCTYLDI